MVYGMLIKLQLQLHLLIEEGRLCIEGKVVDQVLILVVHHTLLHPSVNMNEGNNYLKLPFGIYLVDRF